MKGPAVSVILPTYNRAPTLARAIDSVLAQSFADLELLVVDDASTDDTQALMGAVRDPRVRYVRRAKRGGAGAARNVGITHSKAPIVCFQDSDDEWLTDKLEKQLGALSNSDPAVGLVYCSVLRWTPRGLTYFPVPRLHPVRQGDLRSLIPAGNYVSTQTWLVRRECFDSTGGFDEGLPANEDWEWMMRFVQHRRVAFVDEALVMTYESPDSLSINIKAQIQSLTAILQKHQGGLSQNSPLALANLHYMLGKVRCLNGEVTASRRDFLTALSVNPRDVRFFLGWLLTLGGKSTFSAAWKASQFIRYGAR